MQITHKGFAIHLDQCAYLQKVVEHCGMLNAKSASTPLLAGYYATKNTEPVDAELVDIECLCTLIVLMHAFFSDYFSSFLSWIIT